MLKVVGLTKIYSPKKGVAVRALDGVDLEFPERGLVFLLGKSGSGKSTLLNVAGGLDAPTEGEIIVKGKSSKDFTQSDFDSYRNTYVGFIFQEYNILNEFTVEDNIALALELQGKPKDKEAVAALLEEVDLAGYAKRKPNTLSGGQKQRIAIARALIKSPEIIMADEPTGALDSATGKQVFDTLKKLSADKLVIVVSHDREFAEQYGDRIIELKDGKILSDVTKTVAEGQTLSENVSDLGELLCVKKGSDLTEKDFAQIKAFLQKSDGDVLIAGGEKNVKDIKKLSRISEDGGREVFRETDTEKIAQKQYGKDDAKFLRSRLPLRHAVRMGLSGLKSKPVRLFFTVFLCTVAFVLFGLLSTLTFYNSEATFKETLASGAVTGAELRKEFTGTYRFYENGQLRDEYEQSFSARFTAAELKEMEGTLGDKIFGAVSTSVNIDVRNRSSYYVPEVRAYGYLPEGHPLRETLAAYPTANDEIVLSSFLADTIVACGGYGADGKAFDVSSKEMLIGKKIKIGGYEYTVVGILDSGSIPEKFAALKGDGEADHRLLQEYDEYLYDGLHGLVFVTQEVLEAHGGYFYAGPAMDDNRIVTLAALGEDGTLNFAEHGGNYYRKYSAYAGEGFFHPIVNGKTAPANGEVVVAIDAFLEALAYLYESADGTFDKFDDMTVQRYYEGRSALENARNSSLTLTERQSEAKRGIAILREAGFIPQTLVLRFVSMTDARPFGEEMRFSLVGLIFESDDRSGDMRGVYLSDADVDRLWRAQKDTLTHYDEFESKYVAPADAMYDFAYIPFEGSDAQIDHFWTLYENEAFDENATRTFLMSNAIQTLRSVDETVQLLSQVFLWVGLVLALFAALLLSNFISVSIAQKKREIGVLRAVGARGTDVFRIFFAESAFITLICVLLSTVGSLILCSVINSALVEGLGASVTVFGILSFAVLLGVALLTAVLATFLPVYNAARKKPVESIRAQG